MRERIKGFEEELNRLNQRQQEILAMKDAEGDKSEIASKLADELIKLAIDKKALEKRLDAEIRKREKLDKICVPIIAITGIITIIMLIVTVITWIVEKSFPIVLGTIDIIGVLIIVITIIVMKAINPDQRIF